MTSRFVLHQCGDQFSFRLHSGSNAELLLTGESYTRKSSALGAIEAVRACAVTRENFRGRRSPQGERYFVLEAGNGQVIGTGPLCSSREARDAGIAAVQAEAPSAPIEDATGNIVSLS